MKDKLKTISCLLFFMFFSILLFSQQVKEELNIMIEPVFNGEKLRKGYWYISKTGDSIQFKKVKFYLTDFKFELTNNTYHEINKNYCLIDVFNDETLFKSLKIPKDKKIKEVYFSLGVKGSLSESGAHSRDLDPANGMYWAWQSGYINMKIEGVSPNCPARKNKFTFHIGGFQEPYSTLRKLSFPVSHNQKKLTLVVDIATFFDDIILKENHSVMIPGEEASGLANTSVKMFSLKE